VRRSGFLEVLAVHSFPVRPHLKSSAERSSCMGATSAFTTVVGESSYSESDAGVSRRHTVAAQPGH